MKYLKQIKNKITSNTYDADYINKMKSILTNGDKNLLVANIMKINDTLNINKITNKQNTTGVQVKPKRKYVRKNTVNTV